MIHTAEGFSIVNETGRYFLLPAFSMIQQIVDSLTSGSSVFSQPSLYVWKFLVYILLKPSMQDFKHDFTNMGDEYNFFLEMNIIVWWFEHSLVLPFLRIEIRNYLSTPVATAGSSNFADILSATLW